MPENLFAELRATVLEALARILPDLPPETLAKVEVTPTRDAAHGEMATNAALVVSRHARRRPVEIADELAKVLKGFRVPGELSVRQGDQTINATGDVEDSSITAKLNVKQDDNGLIADAVVADPGFLNLTLKPAVWLAQLPVLLAAGETYGDGQVGQGVRANVEYVSANPTGPMHVGHCRGAVIGDALANLMAKAGYDVTKEYYVNDAGAQVIALAWAAYWRYLQAIGTTLTEEEYAAGVPGGLQYRGDYLLPVAESLVARHGRELAAPDAGVANPQVWFAVVRDATLEQMLASIREDLALLGVEHDVFSSERVLVAAGAADATIERLREAGLIYEGTLEPPKGKLPDDWEPREQTLFRATKFGDSVDRPLRKSDGSNTYFANDIAYHADKIARGAQVMIDIWGADHGGYVSRMQSAVRALGAATGGGPELEIVLCQIVHVLKDGEPVRMSKRAGTFITLRDLIDEVGRDAVRFTMLTRKSDAQMEFDIAAAVAQTRENPVFYVQYAHARCRSVLRAAAEQFGPAATSPQALAQVDLSSLVHDSELLLIRRLCAWPRVVEAAALAREPHRIAFFLYDLAADFHMLWNRGREDAALRFLQAEQPAETLARVALVTATAMVIRSGMAVMGVTPVEEMR